MGSVGQQHMGNAISLASFSHQLRDLWRSPRGTVLRIEALALAAIALSFFLAVFGSCRRWSNSLIIQKGFLAANALFLSLGTYSIGLMQSSPVKSEMYPIWAVSLLALLCCVNSTGASGLDNKSQLWRMLYQLCLYFGYVLLMSITTISSKIGNIAICVLASLTFIKGFHMSMAVVIPSSMRNMIRQISAYNIRKCSFGDLGEERDLVVYNSFPVMIGHRFHISMGDIASMGSKEGSSRVASHIRACKDVCLSFSLSHLLHRRFLGLSNVQEIATSTEPLVKDYNRAMEVVEVELAFMYDVLYTSNAFLHYYEARGASIWAFASVIGICFVGAVAVIPGARTIRRASPGTVMVDATVTDYVITGVILVCLALLQVLQLLRCWTSNWARVAFACDWVRRTKGNMLSEKKGMNWRLILRESLIKNNWFDKKYLWQNKLGQHSLIGSISVPGHYHRLFCGSLDRFVNWMFSCYAFDVTLLFLVYCWRLLGLKYMGRVLAEILSSNRGEDHVQLYPDVKKSIGDFITTNIKGDEVSGWAYSRTSKKDRPIGSDLLPDFVVVAQQSLADAPYLSDDDIFVPCILMWHIATCYCELWQQQQRGADAAGVDMDHQRVAMALSKYCAYLVVSAPGLLPGRSEATTSLYNEVSQLAKRLFAQEDNKLQALENYSMPDGFFDEHLPFYVYVYALGVRLGKGLVHGMSPAPRWELLADFWVKALVYAAPSDNVEEHMQHLAQGGELITHLWAMLYHAGIHEWKLNPPQSSSVTIGWDFIFQIRSWKDLKGPRPHQPSQLRNRRKQSHNPKSL